MTELVVCEVASRIETKFVLGQFDVSSITKKKKKISTSLHTTQNLH